MITPLLAPPCGAQEGEAQDTYILATGRRLPYLYVISLDDAIDPANNNTTNAIVSRSKVALDRLDGRLLGDPANLIVSEDGGTVYVVNHIEMGPKGGDELNRIQRGKNYGYPIVSNGDHYDDRVIPDHDTHPEFEKPAVWWTPDISPGS